MKNNDAISGMFISLSPDESNLLREYCKECSIEFAPRGLKQILFDAVSDAQDEEPQNSDSFSRIVEHTRQFIRDNPQTVQTASSFISGILRKRT